MTDLLALFGHCLLLSLLAIGGAIATVPDLQRVVVVEHGWLDAGQFTGAVALAQAAPGPNLLFVAVVGYQALGLPGALAGMGGMLLPSTALTLLLTRWGQRRRDSLPVRAFVRGMAPVTLGLVLTSGLLLAAPVMREPPAVALFLASALVAWRTRWNPLWLLALGGLAGAIGGV
ncbi:chromate transporter [Ideonella sp.]|uniref:chromate transporter n=1 Tax=Ideonella sp. TaxID=1929293 RepID=UPI0035B3E598